MDTATLTRLDWAALYLQHRDAMYRVARAVLHRIGRPDLAMDAVHDVMTSMLDNPDREITDHGAYLIRAAHLRALAIAKLHDNWRSAVLDEDDHTTDGFESDAVQDIDRARRYARLHREVASLPEMQRRVIEEVMLKERTAVQVAEELHLSQSRISQIRKDALLTLRDRLGKGPTV